jgi:single-stranded DNA-binding protein
MLDDMNLVILEGTVMFTPEIVENNGKKVINFLVENVRKSRDKETHFKYNCVVWGAVAERVVDRLKEGARVRINGHLQDNTMLMPDEKMFHYSKTCVDYIEFE